jgi:hypothetical protein
MERKGTTEDERKGTIEDGKERMKERMQMGELTVLVGEQAKERKRLWQGG